MADRQFYDPQSTTNEIKNVEVRFLFNGTSNPATTYGLGYTVARTGVGTYTVTLSDKYAQFLGFNWGVGKTALVAADVVCTGHVVGGSATNTFSFTYAEAGAAADPAANAANWLSITLKFRNTTVNP